MLPCMRSSTSGCPELGGPPCCSRNAWCEGPTFVQVPLLSQLAGVRVPHGSSLVGAAAQQQGAFAAPLEAEDGPLVAFQRPHQLACAWCGLSPPSPVLCRQCGGLYQGSSMTVVLCQPCSRTISVGTAAGLGETSQKGGACQLHCMLRHLAAICLGNTTTCTLSCNGQDWSLPASTSAERRARPQALKLSRPQPAICQAWWAPQEQAAAPELVQMRALPSTEPEASRVPSQRQSITVMSRDGCPELLPVLQDLGWGWLLLWLAQVPQTYGRVSRPGPPHGA